MAPKSKQVAHHARAQGKGKGKGSEEFDPVYELELYRQLPLQARNDVVSVAEKLVVADDGMTIDIALPMANRIRREDRDFFDNILREEEPRFNARGQDRVRSGRAGNLPDALVRQHGEPAGRRRVGRLPAPGEGDEVGCGE